MRLIRKSALVAGFLCMPAIAYGESCYSDDAASEASHGAAETAIESEVSSGTLVEHDVGRLDALSTAVTVLAPEGATAERAVARIRDVLPTIDSAFDAVSMRHTSPATLTVQLTDVPAPGSAASGTTAADTSCLYSQCDITVYRETWHDESDYFTFVFAHETAHVAQGLVYRVEDCDTYWWVEGTAEWFANVAMPGKDHSGYIIGDFERLSHSTSLVKMDYPAMAFFFWAGAEYGLDYPFSLGRHGDDLADVETVLDLLPPDAWHDFVEVFLDGELRYPDGRPAWPIVSMGEEVFIGDGESVEISGEPLSIPRIVADIDPGEWEVALEGDNPRVGFRQDDEGGAGTWFRLNPTTGSSVGFSVSETCENDTALVMAAIGQVSHGFSVTARLEGEPDGCGCENPPPEDHCMVGAWAAEATDLPHNYNQIASLFDHPSRWTGQDMGDNYMILAPDGTFELVNTNSESEYRHQLGDEIMTQNVYIQYYSSGRWSPLEEGRMELCPQEADGEMINVMSVGGVSESSGPMPLPGADEDAGSEATYTYRCNGDEAEVTLLRFGAFPMATWYVYRVPMPAPIDEPF